MAFGAIFQSLKVRHFKRSFKVFHFIFFKLFQYIWTTRMDVAPSDACADRARNRQDAQRKCGQWLLYMV